MILSIFLDFGVVILSFFFKRNENFTDNLLFVISYIAILAFNISNFLI